MTIGLKDDKAAVNIAPNLTAAEAYLLLGTLALHLLNSYYKVATTTLNINHNSGKTDSNSKLSKSELNSAIKGIKDSMYDAMDSVFSNVLSQFMPEHPRYTLEDEAIIELTNQKIEEEYNKLSDEDKEAYRQTYNQTLSKLKEQVNANVANKDEDIESTGTTSTASTTDSTTTSSTTTSSTATATNSTN